MQTSLLALCLLFINIHAQNDHENSNDYAEVRALLDQYYQITARKFGFFHDYDPKQVSKMLQNIPTDDGTEASINRKEGVAGDLFESDILLALPQIRALLRETSKSRDARQAIRGTQHNWVKMPISYRFGYSDVKWQKLIRMAVHHIESETCVRFQENGYDRDHILFTRASGCWSSVGRIGGRQLISIGYGCDSMGIVAHETLHALGLWHEQSRSDRDKYIWINYINIYPGIQGNFERRTTLNSDNMGQPYDLGSVMHYGSKAFTMNFKRNTIKTRDRQYQHTIGQRQGISFKDAKMINLRYCNGSCRHQMYCYNGGYVDPNNCFQCKCPNGFGGKDCSSVQKSDCGGELRADYNFQIINSTDLGVNAHCIWRIRSAARVLIYIDELQLPCKESCISYLELKYRSDMVVTGPRLCCGPSNVPIVSENGTFIVMYVANASTDDRRLRGFKLRYKLYYYHRFFTNCYYCSSENNCGGSREDTKECAEKRCPVGTSYRCRGRLVMPCDVLQLLQFVADKGAHLVSNDKSFFVDSIKYKKRYSKLAYPGEQLCEKYFDYQCSLPMLTLYLGWKATNGWLEIDGRGCCNGYHYNGTACVRD